MKNTETKRTRVSTGVKHIKQKQSGGVTTQQQKDNNLLEAIKTSEIDKVELALAEGADVNAKNENGDPALIVAIRPAGTEIVKLLLENGADANAKQIAFDFPALTFASSRGFTEMVRLLLENGADINAKDKIRGLTALMVASVNGYIETSRFLLENGADINTQNLRGMTALMLASTRDSIEIVRLLLEYGANVNIITSTNRTAITLARITNASSNDANANARRDEIVELLLATQATQKQKDNNLLEAIKTIEIDKVELALAEGADVNAKNEDGDPALILAVGTSAMLDGEDTEIKIIRIMKLLLENGADVNAKEIGYRATALAFAISQGVIGIVRFLLENGADITAKDIRGYTPLVEAAFSNEIEAGRLLLENGADINATDLEGMTALMVASVRGRIEFVRLLLEYGADVNIVDNHNYTAIMLARMVNANSNNANANARRDEIVELLSYQEYQTPICMSQEEYDECDKNDDGEVIDPLLIEPVLRENAVKLEGQPKICYDRAALKRWTETRKTNPMTNQPISDDWIRKNLGEQRCEEPPMTGGKTRRKPNKKRKTKTTKSNKKNKNNTRKTKRK